MPLSYVLAYPGQERSISQWVVFQEMLRKSFDKHPQHVLPWNRDLGKRPTQEVFRYHYYYS